MTEKKMKTAKYIVGCLILLAGILILTQSYLGFVKDQVTAALRAEAAEAGSPDLQIDFMSAFRASFEYVQGIATFLVSMLFLIPGLLAALLNYWIYTRGAEAFETL